MRRVTNIQMPILHLKVYIQTVICMSYKNIYYPIGPKITTVDDFWRMVWQYKISHIVMLTGVCEGGRVSD